MERTAQKAGIQVVDELYTSYLDYADDVVLLAEQTDTLRSAFVEFCQTAEKLGLHLSWQKTKIQNLGSGDSATDITVGGNTVEAVTKFRYLHTVILRQMLPRYKSTHWSGLLCHACHAALLATTEIEFGHQTATLPNLCSSDSAVYGADTWTLLANDIRRLQSFRMGCQRQILGVRWQDHVKNVDIADTTGQST